MTRVEEYRRAAELLQRGNIHPLRQNTSFTADELSSYNLAITALERLAKGELVERAQVEKQHAALQEALRLACDCHAASCGDTTCPVHAYYLRGHGS